MFELAFSEGANKGIGNADRSFLLDTSQEDALSDALKTLGLDSK
jgi:hypothetical protein